MKYHTLDELRTVAEVEPYGVRTMSWSERLDRWAELLERNPHWHLSTLHETEYQTPEIRAAMRSDHSPLSIAFADPVLRAAGLNDDTYGEAKRFFQLEDGQLHEIICYCHFGATVPAASAARQIRSMIGPPPTGFFARLRQMMFG
jgi:hypothetical protein